MVRASSSEVIVMQRRSIWGIAATAALLLSGLPAYAEEEMDPAAMAKALTEASVSLDQGLKASTRDGTPISGKYEIEHGALQLSVYTMKGANFGEVIVDHKSGAIKKSDPITDADDMKAAKTQAAAMALAKLPLDAAVGNAVKANSGYRAVSIMPMVDGGRPVATVVLMKGQDVKKVTEKLD
jgi:hypothetical protein